MAADFSSLPKNRAKRTTVLWLLRSVGFGLLSACSALPTAELATDSKPSAALSAAPL